MLKLLVMLVCVMALSIGAGLPNYSAVYAGGTPILSVYQGKDLVWQRVTVSIYTTLPEDRFLHFNDYAVSNAPNPVWVHEGPVASGLGNPPKALLPGTNHWHRGGWVFRSCRTGTSGAQSGGPRIIPPVTPIPTYPLASSNLAANLRNDLNALIESPVFTNGIGTVYFEAINSLQPYPTQITIDISTNTADAASVWHVTEVLNLAAATSNNFTRYTLRLNVAYPTRIRIRKTSNSYAGTPDAYFTVIDNIRVSYPPTPTEAYKSPDYTGSGYDYPVETP